MLVFVTSNGSFPVLSKRTTLASCAQQHCVVSVNGDILQGSGCFVLARRANGDFQKKAYVPQNSQLAAVTAIVRRRLDLFFAVGWALSITGIVRHFPMQLGALTVCRRAGN